MKPEPIYVLLEGGLVREVINIPDDMQVVVVDTDIEGADPEDVTVSPVDGEACVLTSFPYETEPR